MHVNLPAGNDFNSTQGTTDSSNLVWRAGNSAPNVRFTVPIINDDTLEPDEVLEIEIQCENNGNCYIPQQIYTITIIDDQGTYNSRHSCLVLCA